MMSWGGLVKFTTGFVLAIAILFFTGVNTARYLITRLTTPPPRPTFPNDLPAATPPPASPVAPAAATPAAEAPVPTSVEPSPEPSPSLEPGAYQARVTQPIGLIVRMEPNRDAERVGGLDYEQAVTIVGESPDGEWLRVRLSNDGTEGWIKAGNTERLN